MSFSTIANYGGKQANNTAYIKTFNLGVPQQLWTVFQLTDPDNALVIKPIEGLSNLYIPNNIYIGGSIITTSDMNIKENIKEIDEEETEKLMKLEGKKYNYKDDETNKSHYGFIAQEVEKYYPELVVEGIHNSEKVKCINYLEMIPLLVNKIKEMQKEIDNLKEHIGK